MGLITIDQAKKARIDADAALRAEDAWFASETAKGYTSPEGYVLGLTDRDVTLLTGNFVLAKEAAALGAPLPPVIDKDGGVHQIDSIEDLTLLMLAYGQHRAALSAEYSARKAAIEV
jgi:hypothetical protein